MPHPVSQSTRAARKESAPIRDCPILDGSAKAKFKDAKIAASDLSLEVLHFLEAKSPEAQAAWLTTSVKASRDVLQPWSLEIVFVIGTRGSVRFNELHSLLGLSTRTLSDKLQSLRDAGLVERTVHDEQPVRIEYTLTRHGRATAALATPLLTHLNLEAVRVASAE